MHLMIKWITAKRKKKLIEIPCQLNISISCIHFNVQIATEFTSKESALHYISDIHLYITWKCWSFKKEKKSFRKAPKIATVKIASTHWHTFRIAWLPCCIAIKKFTKKHCISYNIEQKKLPWASQEKLILTLPHSLI